MASLPPLRKIKKKNLSLKETHAELRESAKSLGCLQGTGATAGTKGQTQFFF